MAFSIGRRKEVWDGAEPRVGGVTAKRADEKGNISSRRVEGHVTEMQLMFVDISHSPIANLIMHVFGRGGTQITYTSTCSTLKNAHTDKLSRRTNSKVNITINT